MLLLILAIPGASILDIDYFSPGPNQRSWRRQRRMDADIDGAGSDGLLLVPKAYCCLTFNLLLLSVTYWLIGRPCRDIRVSKARPYQPWLTTTGKNQTEATALLSRTEEESVKILISPHLARNFAAADNWQRFCLKALLRLDITLLRGRVISGRDPSRKGDAKGFQ